MFEKIQVNFWKILGTSSPKQNSNLRRWLGQFWWIFYFSPPSATVLGGEKKYDACSRCVSCCTVRADLLLRCEFQKRVQRFCQRIGTISLHIDDVLLWISDPSCLLLYWSNNLILKHRADLIEKSCLVSRLNMTSSLLETWLIGALCL